MACFFRRDQAHLDFAIAERKYLRPEHRGVGDAHQLELLLPGQIAGDDEDQGPSGEPWIWVAWMAPVDLLLLGIEPVEVQLRGRRQGLNDVFQRDNGRSG